MIHTIPWVLDLFCCAGGATRGYQRAGFRVLGVDVVAHPDYCGDALLVGDALQVLQVLDPADFVLVHASPPCQAGCTLQAGTNAARGRRHPRLVGPTRAALQAFGVPFVIEQPTGHAGLIRTDLRLCGDMFRAGPPPWVQRHRDFELQGVFVPQPVHPRHVGYVRGWRHGVYRDGPYVAAYGDGGGKASTAEIRHALGIDWTEDRTALVEAIPPAYTEWIGGYVVRG